MYHSISMMNGTVVSITANDNGSYFTTEDQDGRQYLSKRIILATGFRDLLPNTPGLADIWGRGIYWCTWCDGNEHKNASFGTLGSFSSSLIQSAFTSMTLNPDPLILTNGTYTNSTIAQVSAKLPDWAEKLAACNIGIENRTITSFSRLHGNESDFSDDILIKFSDDRTVVRNAILADFEAQLRSTLPLGMGLKLRKEDGGEVHVETDDNMESSMKGVFVVGDANSDQSHNVPHAVWSAKRSVVYLHSRGLPSLKQLNQSSISLTA